MSIIVGDRLGDLSGRQRGGNQILDNLATGPGTDVFGDVSGSLARPVPRRQRPHHREREREPPVRRRLAMTGSSLGGNDTLLALSFNQELYGDAMTMSGSAKGGQDVLTVNSLYENLVVGDAATMTGNTVGGKDKILVLGNNRATR